MTDSLSREERSALMSRVRGRDTTPELSLRKALHAQGLRYRLHRRDLAGSPDIVLPRYRTIVFVHGCFWHRHIGCRHASTPKSNVEFWMRKFAANVTRDSRTKAALESDGWRVLVVWACELDTLTKTGSTAQRVGDWIRDEKQSPSPSIEGPGRLAPEGGTAPDMPEEER